MIHYASISIEINLPPRRAPAVIHRYARTLRIDSGTCVSTKRTCDSVIRGILERMRR